MTEINGCKLGTYFPNDTGIQVKFNQNGHFLGLILIILCFKFSGANETTVECSPINAHLPRVQNPTKLVQNKLLFLSSQGVPFGDVEH